MKIFVIPYLVILFKNMVIPAFVIPTNLSITKNRYNKKKKGITKKIGGITKNKTNALGCENLGGIPNP